MPTILISGAANGLGAAFVEAYRALPDVKIIATDKSPIKVSSDNITSFQVDVTNELSIKRFVEEIDGRSIDLLVHSAGMRGLVSTVEEQRPDNVPMCETLQVMDIATLTVAFQVNAVGTFSFLRALLPSLMMASDPKVIVMASRMGSIGNNELPNKDAGSAYAYRASKAATNAIVRSFAVDVPGVTFIMCHPGRVETNLVRCKEEGAISAEESVGQIMQLIRRWKRKDSGKFYDRFGNAIEW